MRWYSNWRLWLLVVTIFLCVPFTSICFDADTAGIVVWIVKKGDDSWESFFRAGRDSILTDTVNVIQRRDGIVWLKYQASKYDTLEIISSGGDDTTRVFYRKIIREIPYSMSEWTIIKRGSLSD